MACFERGSPALKEILLKLYRAQKPMEIDHHLYEFGSVEYHVQCSASDPQLTYLSISTPLLSQGVLQSYGLSHYTIQMVEGICSDVVEIFEPAKQGYQLTLRLDFSKIPNKKDSEKIIEKISAVQAVIISSQLKEMLQSVNSQDSYQGMYKPIKLIYHPREPFFVIKQFGQASASQEALLEKVTNVETHCLPRKNAFRASEAQKLPQKIIAIFPMRFKEDSDVIIATAFFQELMDVGSSEKWAKAPSCNWSPIPPPELRGETFNDLSTNGGFVSFDIFPRHVESKRLDKTVWSLLNFYAYVKYHVKSTRGFIQRRMRNRLERLVQVLHTPSSGEIETKTNKVKERRFMTRLIKLTKSNIIKRKCGALSKKIKRIRFRIKIHGFGRFRRQWLKLKMPSFSSSKGYTKLE